MLTLAAGKTCTVVHNLYKWGGDLAVLISWSEVQCLAYDILRVDEELLDDTYSVCTPSPLVTEILRWCHLIQEK